MTEIGKNHLLEIWPELSPSLKPNEVSEAGIDIIENATTGSVWFIHKHGSKAFEVPEHCENLESLLKVQKSE